QGFLNYSLKGRFRLKRRYDTKSIRKRGEDTLSVMLLKRALDALSNFIHDRYGSNIQ
ncbi:hypothetical protein COCCADRAFT_107250, partial [Bipolaris zeicola 26-R-13]